MTCYLSIIKHACLLNLIKIRHHDSCTVITLMNLIKIAYQTKYVDHFSAGLGGEVTNGFEVIKAVQINMRSI